MEKRPHTDGSDGPDTDELGYRDDAEERAYEQAQSDGPGETAPDASATPSPELPDAAPDAVEGQAEPDDGEPANAG